MHWIYVLTTMLSLTVAAASSASTSVPHKTHFQSVFYDEGGNPLPSGSYYAKFTLIGQSDEILYEEEQGVEMINGVVSIMIGDGSTIGSNLSEPAGGIPVAALEPNQKIYVRVEINGKEHNAPLEIGSVPYSYFSEEALSVAPKSILSESLADGVVQENHLSDVLREAIFGSVAPDRVSSSIVTQDQFSNHTSSQSHAHPAESIYITNPSFAYSRSLDVGNVLKDLDRAIETIRRYTDTKVSKAGDSMSGNLDMGGKSVTNVAPPANSNDASTKAYTDQQYNVLNTQVSTSISSTNASVDTLQGQVNELGDSIAGMPKVVAYAVVRANRDGSVEPTLLGQHNISGVHRVGDSYQVAFSNPISFPYVVVAIAMNSNPDGDRDDMATIVEDAQNNNGFIIRTVNGASGGGPTFTNVSFNFAVIK
ncbi:MAG: hypothetical protein Q7T03_03545 [Deltaproteobacteria bacterium]|nr:hypothetical protein [Deltaproteobacteria bacterium]